MHWPVWSRWQGTCISYPTGCRPTAEQSYPRHAEIFWLLYCALSLYLEPRAPQILANPPRSPFSLCSFEPPALAGRRARLVSVPWSFFSMFGLFRSAPYVNRPDDGRKLILFTRSQLSLLMSMLRVLTGYEDPHWWWPKDFMLLTPSTEY